MFETGVFSGTTSAYAITTLFVRAGHKIAVPPIAINSGVTITSAVCTSGGAIGIPGLCKLTVNGKALTFVGVGLERESGTSTTTVHHVVGGN